MKINIYLCGEILFSLLMPSEIHAQTLDHNYIVTETVLDSNETKKVKSVQYYDGLGRPDVLLVGGMNTNGKYLCSMTEYDSLGHEARLWQPAAGTTSLSFVSKPSMASYSQATFNDQHAFSEVEYDALGRSVFKNTVGDAWHQESKGTRTDYITNAQNSVRRYKLNSSGALVNSPVEYYPANTLTGERVTDEEGHTLETYRDLLGNVVLERRDSDKDTYYVYEKGMLMFVVPPLYKTSPSEDLLYQYKYDVFGHCIEKTLPGCSTTYYTYDPLGRLAFMQDGRMMNEGSYRFFFYDGLGRLVVQGTCSSVPATLLLFPVEVCFESGSAYVGNTGYKIQQGFNPTNPKIEIVNYYDNYDFLSNSSVSTYIGTADLSNNSHANATSLLTGQIVSTSNGKYLCTALYYDEKGNVIERKETLLNGAVLSTTTSYSFTDKPLVSTITLTRKGVTRTVNQTNVYDLNSDRLVLQQHKYGTKPTVSTAIFTYNDLGQIQTLSQHNGALSTSYSYDVHGWLTDINSVVSGTGTPLFQEKLKYVDTARGMGYNGNISEARWMSGSSNSSYRYKYTYDGLNRLTGAAFYAGGLITNDNASFIDDLGSISIQYNTNSAITSLIRRGQLDNGYGAIDNLSFTYSGNQLSRIAEYVPPILHEGSFDFKDNTMNVSGSEYLYDACGSLTADANKGITHIDYDLLGNPVRIQFNDRSYTENVYAADGRKLKTSHITAVPSSNHLALGEMVLLSPFHILSVDSTEYLGNFLFDNGLFKQYHFDGGYFTSTGSEASYKYYVRDHLGSNRILASYNGTIQQETQYYPYGGIHHFSTDQGTQKFKYNGKELDLMHGLNLYDYGARLYDPLVGQFTSMDPLCEKYYHISPYAYCAGDPVNRVDPDGRDWYSTIVNGKRTYHYDDNIHSSKDLKKGQKYEGSTVVVGKKYYSLFGNEKNLNTPEGRLWKLIDDALINYAKNMKEMNNNPENSLPEGVKFNIGYKYKDGLLKDNFYRFTYEGGEARYNCYDERSYPFSNYGYVDVFPSIEGGKKSLGARGFHSAEPTGYLLVIRQLYPRKSATKRGDNVVVTFTSIDAANSFINKFYKQFMNDE